MFGVTRNQCRGYAHLKGERLNVTIRLGRDYARNVRRVRYAVSQELKRCESQASVCELFRSGIGALECCDFHHHFGEPMISDQAELGSTGHNN